MERRVYAETMTAKQSSRLEPELQEAAPGRGEGSIRQSWKLQRAVLLQPRLGADVTVSDETLRGCRKSFCKGSAQKALLLGTAGN